MYKNINNVIKLTIVYIFKKKFELFYLIKLEKCLKPCSFIKQF